MFNCRFLPLSLITWNGFIFPSSSIKESLFMDIDSDSFENAAIIAIMNWTPASCLTYPEWFKQFIMAALKLLAQEMPILCSTPDGSHLSLESITEPAQANPIPLSFFSFIPVLSLSFLPFCSLNWCLVFLLIGDNNFKILARVISPRGSECCDHSPRVQDRS